MVWLLVTVPESACNEGRQDKKFYETIRKTDEVLIFFKNANVSFAFLFAEGL
jgi:hypothetical protein